MKKIIFFFMAVIAISFGSCVDMNDPLENSVYTFELNGVRYHSGDTVKCQIGQNFRVALLENGVSSQADFMFDNVTVNVFSVYQAFVTYDRAGTYQISAESVSTGEKVKVYIMVGNFQIYTLKINNVTVKNDSTFRATVGTKLGFKVLDLYGKKVETAFDFGDGQKITTDSVAIAYNTKGTYTFKAVTSGITIRVNMIVGDELISGEAIILISYSIYGSNNIDAVLGLRCDAINNVDITKTIYVSGEIPGAYWQDYNIGHEVEYINNIAYFKWHVSTPVGNYRMSWIQLKPGKTEFKYDNCTWAYMPKSKYWNSEGLFRFTTYIENGVAKIKP